MAGPPPKLTYTIETDPYSGDIQAVSVIEGTRVAWVFCGVCKLHISQCLHDVPIEPAYLRRPPFTSAPQTPVPGDYRYGEMPDRVREKVATRRAALNVMDLVDQDLVDKIKDSKGSNDATNG